MYATQRSGNTEIWGQAENGEHGTSWMLLILPYLEQQPLYDSWDFTKNVKGNQATATTDIAAFYCPSRRNQVRAEDEAMMFLSWSGGGTDYAGCTSGGRTPWDSA